MPDISKCCSKISQRWLTVTLALVIVFNMYGMRTCLSIAITEMTLPPNRIEVLLNDTDLQNDDNTNSTYIKRLDSLNKTKYDWNERTQGLILSSFYWGYIIGSSVGGTINQKFGSRCTFSWVLICTSAFTLLIPHGTTSGGSTGLIVLRFGIGLAEGLVSPSLASLLAHWIPKDERSKAGAVLYSGIPLGSIYGILLSGVILQHSSSGWPMVFYFFGTVGFVTLFLILAFYYNEPSKSPLIGEKELNYLKNNLKNTHPKLPPVPWRYILKSLPVWTMHISAAGQIYGLIIITSDMPKYMKSVLNLSVQSNGLLSSIPHLSMWIACNICSWAADKLIVKKILSITATRKIGCAISSIGTPVFMIAASYVCCNGALVTMMLSASSCCLSSVFFSTAINPVDLSPNFAAITMGMMHALATPFSMLAPVVVGVMTPNQTLNEWRSAFWVTFAVMVASSFSYFIYGSGEVQEWNDPAFLNRKRPVNKDGVKESIDLLHVPE